MSDNMELAVWKDGTIRLAFWDRNYGCDRTFELHEDGTCTEFGTTVRLVHELRRLALKLEENNKCQQCGHNWQIDGPCQCVREVWRNNMPTE